MSGEEWQKMLEAEGAHDWYQGAITNLCQTYFNGALLGQKEAQEAMKRFQRGLRLARVSYEMLRQELGVDR